MNRVVKIQDYTKEWGKNVDSDMMEELEHEEKILVDRIFHINGKLNTADLATCQGIEVE